MLLQTKARIISEENLPELAAYFPGRFLAVPDGQQIGHVLVVNDKKLQIRDGETLIKISNKWMPRPVFNALYGVESELSSESFVDCYSLDYYGVIVKL